MYHLEFMPFPANTTRLTTSDLMMGHRLRRCPIIESVVVKRPVFAAVPITVHGIYHCKQWQIRPYKPLKYNTAE